MRSNFKLVIFLIYLFISFSLQALGHGELQEKSLSYEGITQVRIQGERFDIQVMGDPSGVLTGTIQGDSQDRITLKRSGDLLTIEVDNDGSFFSNRLPGSMVLHVPKLCDLDLRTGSGRIQVEGLEEGKLILESASGDLVARNLQRKGRFNSASGSVTLTNISGAVRISTASGSIRGKDLGVGTEAKSVSGSIELQNPVGALRLGSTSGSLFVKDWMAYSDSDFSSISGSIRIQGINQADFSIQAGSTSGEISLWGSSQGHRTTTGNGDVKIKVTTVSGNITIE